MKILLTGLPKSGKTTLIKKIINKFPENCEGFYTEEIIEDGNRTGFKIKTINGKQGILASSKNKFSNIKIGRYFVNINDINNIMVPQIKPLPPYKILIIDEIGKMELMSDIFRTSIENIFKTKCNILATISYKSTPFTDRLKLLTHVKLFTLQKKNYNENYIKIVNLILNKFNN